MAREFTINGVRWQVESPAGAESRPGETQATVARQRDHGHMDWDDAGGAIMLASMAVFWLGLLALGAWAIAAYARRSDRAPRESPLDIARRRYASGEISAEELEAIRQNLEK